MDRLNISSHTLWEDKVGYSRAVRVGPMVFVSGTAAIDEHGMVTPLYDAHGQTLLILRKIEKALIQAGATLQHVVRTRIYVTEMDAIDQVVQAHSEIFDSIRPVSTLVKVEALIEPAMMVEIEVDAYIG